MKSCNRAILALLACIGTVSPLSGHFHPMIEVTRPEPPPPLEPADNWALLRVRITDGQEGEPVSATVSINGGAIEPADNPYRKYGLRYSGNRLKGPVRFRDLDYYFYTDGRFDVLVPPGACTISAGRGYEYLRAEVSLDVAARDTADVTVPLRRWTDMAEKGWYSGDTHIHVDRTGANDDSLLALTSAKDIRYAYLLSMNTDGYDRGRRYESWEQATGLGDNSVARRGAYYISSGQEYRSGELGHVTVLLTDEYVPGPDSASADVGAGPSLAVIADQAHALNGFIGLAHGGYHHTETDGLLLEDKMDFLELLQFGGYRSLGLDGWYDFLNIGFRLPIVGACDFPYTRELGSEVTYVYADSAPSPRRWAELAAAGRSFATSGPMLVATVDGRRPGEIFTLYSGADTTVTVDISVRSPLYPLDCVEIVVDGWARWRQRFDMPVESAEISRRITIRSSSWLAVRASGPAGTEAHTNPVYFYAGDNPPFNRDSARRIIGRLEGSMERVSSPDVRSRLGRAKLAVEALLEGRPAGLPLPSPAREHR